jgi:uncharacterized membrane protein HdeD (DUF308 family)
VTERHTFYCFLAVLLAIVGLFCVASLLLYHGRSVEAVGIGGVMTGLIGVLGGLRPQSRKAEEPPVSIAPKEEPKP